MTPGSLPQPEITDKVRPAVRQTGTAGRGGPENLLYLERRTPGTPLLQSSVIAACVALAAALGGLFFVAEAGRSGTATVVLTALAGVALGAFSLWLWVRTHFARSLAHVESFRRRLMSVERDQALWISLSAVLHDVRNPMHNVTLLTELLGSPESNVARIREQMLAELERINVRMRRVREQIAEFSGEIERRTVVLHEVLAEVDDMVGPLARRDGVAFSYRCGPHLKVVADPKFLVQAIDHLLLNSLQILSEQPPEKPRRLSITVESEGEAIALLVDDTGPGLPEPVRTRPFEPLGTSRRGGMGLGLTIAHALARAAGGELSVARTDVSGTQFRLRLTSV